MVEKRGGLIEGEKRAYLTSTDRVSEVGMSSSNFGGFSGTIPSFDSTISSRRLALVSLRYQSWIIKGEYVDIWRIWTYSLCTSNRA